MSSITVTTTAHVKLVSAVLRGERVESGGLGGGGCSGGDDGASSRHYSVSRQVKAYCIVPLFTTALSTMAVQVRVVLSNPPPSHQRGSPQEWRLPVGHSSC